MISICFVFFIHLWIILAHVASVHGKGMTKQANKQTRTLEFEFTLAPRNSRQQDGGGGGGGNNSNGGGNHVSRYRQRQNERESQYDNYNDDAFLASASAQPTSYDASNESDFPSLLGAGAGSSATMFSLQPTVNQSRAFGRSGLARTKENFPALGKDTQQQDSNASNNSAGIYNKNSASALLKNNAFSGNTNSSSALGNNYQKLSSSNNGSGSGGGVVIHVSNRPKKHQPTAKDFPSLPGSSKSNLDSDFIPPSSLSMSAAVSAKHRTLIDGYESVGGREKDTKISMVQRSSTNEKKTLEKAPKIDSVNMFPALGGGGSSAAAPTATWVTKKPPVESKKTKVAPPPLSTNTKSNQAAAAATTKSKPNQQSSSSSSSSVTNKQSKKENKTTKSGETKPPTKSSKKFTTTASSNDDSETDSIVPSAALLSAVSAKHRSLVVDYDPVTSDSSKFHVIQQKDIAIPKKIATVALEDIESKINFPSLKLDGNKSSKNQKHRERNNNVPAKQTSNVCRFSEILNAPPPLPPTDTKSNATNDDDDNTKENNNNTNDELTLTGDDFPSLGLLLTGPPPGFGDKNSNKPPPGFNKVTLNSIATKPSTDLTFTSSLGESYSILPAGYSYVPPPNAMRRNQDLVIQFHGILQQPNVVDEFKMISQLFITGSYLAQPYYEHCLIALGDKFDTIFPELLVLLPDISKQQVNNFLFYFHLLLI